MFLPPGFRDGEPVPLVAEVYPGEMLASRGRNWNPGGGTIPVPLLCANGFAVMFADMPQQSGYPVPEPKLGERILAGIDKAVELGITDHRVGVMGQSAGGLTVNRLIGQTTRFKAAVASAGVSNLISMFDHFRPIGSGFGYSHGVLIEMAMGAPPWEAIDRYVNESPVTHLPKVETPLLLIHGTDDPGVDPAQSAEMFVGLRHLGKKARLLRYRGEAHIPGFFSHANRRHLTEQVLDWLKQHLA